MNYKFQKKHFGSDKDPNPIYDYGVDLNSIVDDKEFGLSGLDWWGWTPEEVQMIIDKSNALIDDNEYDYQVEGSDFYMIIKNSEVLMWARGSEVPDVTWSFIKFIEFMETFKKFIEENQ